MEQAPVDAIGVLELGHQLANIIFQALPLEVSARLRWCGHPERRSSALRSE